MSCTRRECIFQQLVQVQDVQGKNNHPCGQQLLILNGKVLKDESTVAEIKVSEDGFLVAMFSKDLLAGGADSTTITLEWAMTELLRNPAAMEKAKLELQQYCGIDKILQESYISNLPCLQDIMKEMLRMHPVTPILNQKSTTDVEVHGFIVPRDSVVFINIWAMSKDQLIWSDPEAFKPERFVEGSSVDFRGQHFQYVPFGGGRRMCPEMSLANRVVPLMLGSLIHAFDWELPNGMKPEDTDMDDKVGITLQKAIPVRLLPLKKQVGRLEP